MRPVLFNRRYDAIKLLRVQAWSPAGKVSTGAGRPIVPILKALYSAAGTRLPHQGRAGQELGGTRITAYWFWRWMRVLVAAGVVADRAPGSAGRLVPATAEEAMGRVRAGPGMVGILG